MRMPGGYCYRRVDESRLTPVIGRGEGAKGNELARVECKDAPLDTGDRHSYAVAHLVRRKQ